MKKRGVLFIEIVMAMAIFLIGIMPVLSISIASLKYQKKGHQERVVENLTERVVLYIRSRGYENISGMNKTYDDLSYEEVEGAYTSIGFDKDFFGVDSDKDTRDAIFLLNTNGESIGLKDMVIDIEKSGEYYIGSVVLNYWDMVEKVDKTTEEKEFVITPIN